jgi:hypothetical protein
MDFLPFFVCAGLIAASVVACIAALLVNLPPKLRRRLWPLPILAVGPTVGLLSVTAFSVKVIHQGLILNEPMASEACMGNLEEVRA